MAVEYLEVPGYEDRYLVSKDGLIKGVHIKQGVILKYSLNRRGYHKIKLQKGGKKLNTFVHRIVARTYLPNPQNFPEVHHKDGNPANNNVENLEWCTGRENIKQKELLMSDEKKELRAKISREGFIKRGLHQMVGAKNPFAKKVIDTATGEIFGCVGDAATKYGYTYNQLKQWLNGRRKNFSSLSYLPKSNE